MNACHEETIPKMIRSFIIERLEILQKVDKDRAFPFALKHFFKPTTAKKAKHTCSELLYD